MPSPENQDESLSAALSKAISDLHDAHSCSICHGVLSAPVSLPCSHIFCSECARRHLRNKSTCPHPTCRKPATYRQLEPLRSYDLSLEPLRRSADKVEPLKLKAERRLIFLSRKTSTRAQFLERLRAHDIPTYGSTDVISNRYNEFVVRWNANLDAGFPKSKKYIVDAILAAEVVAAKVPKRPRVTSSFFKNVVSQESIKDDEIPTEGDDFETLVKKTKARMEKKRKLANDVARSEKRRCLDSTGHSQKTELASQATVTNEATKSLDNVSQPAAKGTGSNPADVREESNNLREASRDGVSSQFDNNSPLEPCRVEPPGLAVHCNVCSIDVTGQGVDRDFESNLGHANQRIRFNSYGANGLQSQAPLLSQTTPEKLAVPADERHMNSSPTQDAVRIPCSTPTNALPSTQGVQEISGHLPINAVEKNLVSGLESPSEGSGSAMRLRPRIPLRFPVGNGRQMNKKIPRSTGQSEVHADAQLETERKNHTTHDEFRENENPSSTDVTPTRAQLERAERNRLAALERRRKFYELHELSQMRQPDL